MDVISQEYWDQSYKNFDFYIANDGVTDWLHHYKQELLKSKGSLFEFGCYPGRYLSYLGALGWTVNGMDLTPDIEDKRFTGWLKNMGVKTGLLTKGDVLDYARTTNDKYDLVCSFGFIEHFKNFLELILLHDQILKVNGHLVISTPNFRGAIQKTLHANLDSENLKRHFLPAMEPELWKQELEKKGYKIIFSGYFGNFDFWNDEQKRSALQSLSLKVIRKIKPFLRALPNHPSYSPYCGIIAQKTSI